MSGSHVKISAIGYRYGGRRCPLKALAFSPLSPNLDTVGGESKNGAPRAIITSRKPKKLSLKGYNS